MRFSRRELYLVALGWLPLAATEDPVRRVQERFMAPCCWQESVAFHRSDAAADMRAEIAGMVAGGKTDAQIVDFYVARFGERILREPRGAKRWWLTLAPLFTLGLGGAALVAFIRRQRREAPPASNVAAPLPDDLDWD